MGPDSVALPGSRIASDESIGAGAGFTSPASGLRGGCRHFAPAAPGVRILLPRECALLHEYRTRTAEEEDRGKPTCVVDSSYWSSYRA